MDVFNIHQFFFSMKNFKKMEISIIILSRHGEISILTNFDYKMYLLKCLFLTHCYIIIYLYTQLASIGSTNNSFIIVFFKLFVRFIMVQSHVISINIYNSKKRVKNPRNPSMILDCLSKPPRNSWNIFGQHFLSERR